ncbi:MAG: TonB family protein [Thermoanaerobaculaceae bacterium]
MSWNLNRSFRLGLEISVLLHLLLLAVPEKLSLSRTLVASTASPQKTEEKPVTFELVELPQEKEEAPSNPNAPASDLSRRAHGGEGPAAAKPAVKGSNPQLSLSPGVPARAPALEAAPNPEPFPSSSPADATAPSPERLPLPQELTASQEPPQQSREPRPVIKGLSPFSAPQLGIRPDRRGGQVDLGPLSFDTQWYDWGPYAAEMLRRIRYHWRIPELAQMGVPGVVRIRFYIERDGRVTGLTILRESSHPPMDFAARDAILNASPLPPLPKEVGSEREGVIITFYYNTRPPEDS